MNASLYYVEVIYPQAMRIRDETFCIWHKGAKFEATLFDSRPHDVSHWEDTFEFGRSGLSQGPSACERAQAFAEYTHRQLSEWPDTCQGDAYVIRILQDDLRTEVDQIKGTIGSNKPS